MPRQARVASFATRAVPDATPRFFSLDPNHPIPDPLPLPFPLFVKPVSAHLSQLAFPVHDRDELEAAMASAREQLDRVAAFDEELEGRSFHLCSSRSCSKDGS